MGEGRPLTASQPAKLVYTLYVYLSIFFKIPYFGTRYLVPTLRPLGTWSYKLSLFNEYFKGVFNFACATRTAPPRLEKNEKNQDGFVTLEPASPDLLRGPAADTSVKANPVNGIWYPSRPSLSSKHPEKYVAIHFHGGGYVLLSPGHPVVAEAPLNLIASLPISAVLTPEFRLASRPGNTFPAQLQDALAAYSHLLKSVDASRIILSGDSAGGNIVLVLLQYLSEYPVLPKPAAVLLQSPWINLTPEACIVDSNPRRHSDYIPTALLQWGASSVTPKGMKRDSKWISPFFHPADYGVPIFIQDGTAEVLHPDIAKWVDKMKKVGANIEYYPAEGAVHNLLLVAKIMGLDEERDKALAVADKFLEQNLS